MGRQVRFFSSAADAAAFETFAVEENRSTVICGTAPTSEPVAVPTLSVDSVDGTSYDLLLVRPGDLPSLRWRHLAARGVWSVDKNCSPVVEYTPGHRRDGQPAFLTSGTGPGRMWFQTSRWEGAQLVHADADFAAWAGRLFRWVKKHWVLIDGCYFSPDAAKRWTAMWRVVLDEPCEGSGADQISRWRRENDPDNRLPRDAVRVAVTKATRGQPRRLTISIRTPAET